MKFTKHTFLMLGMASIFSTAWIGDGFGVNCMTVTPPAGYFCRVVSSIINPLDPLGQFSIKCSVGCYCPGGNRTALDNSINVDSSCAGKLNESELIRSGLFFCPADFPLSPEGASKIDDCYFTSAEGTKVPIVGYTVDIPSGQYLPKNSVTPKNCPTNESNKFCPGGKRTPRYTERVGVLTCPTVGNVSSDFKKCLISCKAGEYLYLARNQSESILNDTKCKECPEGKVCEGVTDYEYSGIKDRNAKPVGITTCETGKEPNSDQTACVSPNEQENSGSANTTNILITVDAGFYLRPNTIEPIQCSGAKKFCPGGSFYKKSVEQGRYDCPFNANANADKTACELRLTKSQMMNGVSGKGQCWLKTDPEDYKYCIYGVRFENTEDTSSVENTNNNSLVYPYDSTNKSDFKTK